MPLHPHRLQIATRIHYLLMRELGQGIDVERMLKQERYARDVLLVCDACTDSELAELSAQYRLAGAVAPAAPQSEPLVEAPMGQVSRPMVWSADTSGFGMGDDHPDAVARRETPRTHWWQRLVTR